MANDDELRAALLALGNVGVKTAIAELRAQGHEVDSKKIRELRASMPVVEAEPVAPAGKKTAPIEKAPDTQQAPDSLTEELRSKIDELARTIKSLVDDRSAFFRSSDEPADILRTADLLLDLLDPGITLVLEILAYDLDCPTRPTADIPATFKSSIDSCFALLEENLKVYIRTLAARGQESEAQDAVADHMRRRDGIERQAIDLAVGLRDWTSKRKLKTGKPAFTNPSRSSFTGKASGKLWTNREHGEALRAMFGRPPTS